MKTLSHSLSILLLCLAVVAQGQEASLGEQVDTMTDAWDLEAESLQYYDGLTRFCQDKDYRTSTLELLNNIHHTDSILYERAKIAQQRSDDKEIKKLIKDIEKFEEKYSMKSFIKFLREECNALKEIEKNDDDLKTEIGSESYDGQIYILEVEMQKYVKHITKRVDLVRKHVDKLGIK